ncbi:MAG: sulfotransferase domain-containing protein [Hyphomicrobiaceae bacterium]
MTRHLISYPKSGRTWLRYAFTHLGIDDHIVFHHDGFEFNDAALPRLDFAPEPRVERYRGARVVYLARDPRDIMVSLFHQVTGRFADIFCYQGTVSEFLRHDYFGAHNLARFQTLWRELTERGVAIEVKYEDCHADFASSLRRIVDHYGLSVTDERYRAAVEAARFDRMQEVEREGAFSEPWLRPRNGSLKVREGKVGGYKDALSTADIAYLDAVFGANHLPLRSS